jgi:hypothetical protein
MITCLDFSVNDIISHCLSVFLAMSTNHFGLVLDEIGFTPEYNTELQNIAQELSQDLLPSIGLSTLTEMVDYPSYDEERFLNSWQSAFKKLEKIGRAKEICSWILKYKDEETKFRMRAGTTPSWYFIGIDWGKNLDKFPQLLLPQDKIQSLRIIFLKHYVHEFEWHIKFPRLKDEVDYDTWEAYVLDKHGYDSWFKNRIRLHSNITKWTDIFRLLTNDEVEILHKWGYSITKTHYPTQIDYYFSLPEFAKELRDTGYYDL